jgi:uncharacterized protein (TIGR00369 family)
MTISAPRTLGAWLAYYDLRYKVLRQPWQQPPGSEKADDDEQPGIVHALALADDGRSLATGRLHESAPGQGQVRFMAVAPEAQGQGVGGQVLRHLEAQARARGLREIVLHAREVAVAFYQRHGYAVVAPSYTLFGQIPHFLMRKELPVAPSLAQMVGMYNHINHYGRANGMTLHVAQPGEVEYSMSIREEHLSSPNTCHGGVLAGLMDAALGAAALTLAFTAQELVSTVEFKMNFLHAVHLHDALLARAQVEHQGKKLVVTRCVIYRVDAVGETAVAQGLGTFNRYPANKRGFVNELV